MFALVKKEKISNILDMRKDFLNKLEKTLKDIEDLQQKALILLGEFYHLPNLSYHCEFSQISTDFEAYKKAVDSQLWMHLLDLVIKPITSSSRYEEIRKMVKENPVEFTEKNIIDFFNSLPELQKDLITNLVESLYKKMYPSKFEQYKTNKKAIFKFPEKYICKNAFNYILYSHISDFLDDLQKLFLLLDNKVVAKMEYEDLLSTKVNETKNKEKNYYEDEYFKIKIYKNGNLHIQFKRKDLLKKVNEILFKNCDKLPN